MRSHPVLLALALCTMLGVQAACAQGPATDAAGGPRAGATEFPWISYRDAYRAMVRFEKYGQPKQWLQSHLQLLPTARNLPAEGLQLQLRSKSMNLLLPLDAGLRTPLPLLKAAFDDNATLTLNRRSAPLNFQPLVSIAWRADGVFELDDVRTACEQAMAYQRYVAGALARGAQCAGLEVIYAKNSQATLAYFRSPAQESYPLPAGTAMAFSQYLGDGFTSALFRLSDWPARGQLVLPSAPLAILPLWE